MAGYTKAGLAAGMALLIGMVGCGAPKQAARKPDSGKQIVKPGKYSRQALDHFINGNIYDMTEEYDAAIFEYTEALRFDTTSIEIYNALAQDYLIVNLPQKALEMVEKTLALDPDNIDAHEFLSEIQLRAKNLDGALNTLEKIVSIEPGNLEAHYKIIWLSELQNKFDRAAKHYSEVLTIVGPSAEVFSKLGEIYLKQKQFAKAIENYSKAAEEDPSSLQYLDALATAYQQNGEPVKAMDTYERMLVIKEDFAIFARIGSIAFDNQLYQRAIDNFEKADDLMSENANRFVMKRLLGVAYNQIKNHAQAIIELKEALEINAEDLVTLSVLASAYAELGDFTNSDATYERALVIDPDDDLILNNYSYNLSERGVRLQDALKMVEKALAESPENSHYLDTIGWVYYKMGDYQKALVSIQQSVDRDASSAEVHEHLGDVYEKLGEREKAVSSWKKALELEPDRAGLIKKIETLNAGQ